MTPRVSVAIVAYNSDAVLRACLESIRPSALSGFAQVVVVDNASPDGSAAIVETVLAQARLVRSEVNRGFAGGCNLAWPMSVGEYWMLLNPDIVVPQGGLEALVAWMDAHPNLGAASPELRNEAGDRGCAARRFPSIRLSLLEMTRLHKLVGVSRRADMFLGSYWPGGEHLDVDWVPGAALIARRAAVAKVGLLDERIFLYGEDIEWCHRIGRAGWSIGVCDSLRFTHKESSSTLRSLGAAERDSRLWRGIAQALAIMRGRRYAAAWLRVSHAAFFLEALHPGRTDEHRDRSRRHAAVVDEARRWLAKHPV